MRRQSSPEILDHLAAGRSPGHSFAARSSQGQRVHGPRRAGHARLARPRPMPAPHRRARRRRRDAAAEGRHTSGPARRPACAPCSSMRIRRSAPRRARFPRPRLGCRSPTKSDVFDWLLRPAPEQADITLANLFLHHFHEGELSTLLRGRRQADQSLRRLRAAAIADGAGRRVVAASGRLQRCDETRRGHQRARRLPRRRALSALAERPGCAWRKRARGCSRISCVASRA